MPSKKTGEVNQNQIAFVESQVHEVMASQDLKWNEAIDYLDWVRPDWRGYEAPKLYVCQNTLSYRRTVESFPLDAA